MIHSSILVGSDHTLGFYEEVEESIKEQLECLSNSPSAGFVEESKKRRSMIEMGENGEGGGGKEVEESDGGILSPHSSDYWANKLGS